MQKSKIKSQNLQKQVSFTIKTSAGFTLIEILVVIVILGMLMTVAANVFITILSNQNKTALVAEIRQNAALVIDTFTRDVHSASEVGPAGCSGTTCSLLSPNGSTVDWECVAASPGVNGYFRREGVDVTNRDPDNGTSVTTAGCNVFSTDGSLVSLRFQMRQGEASPTTNVQFSTSDTEFSTTVGPRAGSQ